MAKEDNLKPWKKGQSGNPKGRPKGISAKTIIKWWLESSSEYADEYGNLTNFDAMVKAVIKKAKKGDVMAFEKLMDRLEGKPTQYLGNDPENPLININVREKLAKRVKELSNGSGTGGNGQSNGQGS